MKSKNKKIKFQVEYRGRQMTLWAECDKTDGKDINEQVGIRIHLYNKMQTQPHKFLYGINHYEWVFVDEDGCWDFCDIYKNEFQNFILEKSEEFDYLIQCYYERLQEEEVI